ncbi:MAG TPA: hypothetical protein VF173_08750 [Thermoanaerobaculia bacterium]|nr:hypothetical protein [Thermoanaerobaculia bacterium]
MAHPIKIDQLLVLDYPFLSENDECYSLREYKPRAGYAYSATNNFISNLKKEMDRRGRPEWRYKEEAIEEAAGLLATLNSEWLRQTTLVPIPPSTVKDDALYDDRMLRVLRRLEERKGFALDIRELIYQTQSTRSSSRSDRRLTIPELRAVYRVEESLAGPRPGQVCLFDDLLTTGLHFKVAKELLLDRFPQMRVMGIFLARSLH